ncbi:GntR family transcriptional regulator [Kribbella sandramycini]|uniref:GntR family transcriptional regulator n=1 Tax=Kribbella sandramycini TaxID=60450 RepID=A0A7Y4L774_9ACTN|nr:DNA-binding GntR family transcriptional regulator [Kribbella sandramycini]NOL45653.1 GntR family transcriptional regulator [Kribbella sandramycini]
MTTKQLASLATDTLADRAYQAIREAIVGGELRAGEKVTERGLAEQLSVSPTPVREAIRRLEQDGLLERTGPRSVKVSTIGNKAVEDLAEVHAALRGMAARFAARHVTAEQLDRLESTLGEADDLLIVIAQRRSDGLPIEKHIYQLFAVVDRFNDLVTACAGNPVLERLLEQTRVFSQPEARDLRWERIARGEEFGLTRWPNHRALLDALRAGDPARAESVALADVGEAIADLLHGAP